MSNYQVSKGIVGLVTRNQLTQTVSSRLAPGRFFRNLADGSNVIEHPKLSSKLTRRRRSSGLFSGKIDRNVITLVLLLLRLTGDALARALSSLTGEYCILFCASAMGIDIFVSWRGKSTEFYQSLRLFWLRGIIGRPRLRAGCKDRGG